MHSSRSLVCARIGLSSVIMIDPFRGQSSNFQVVIFQSYLVTLSSLQSLPCTNLPSAYSLPSPKLHSLHCHCHDRTPIFPLCSSVVFPISPCCFSIFASFGDGPLRLPTFFVYLLERIVVRYLLFSNLKFLFRLWKWPGLMSTFLKKLWFVTSCFPI